MKTFLSVVASIALTLQTLGIPQTFNNNAFLGAVGVPFEEAAGQIAAFEPGAQPKGQWAPVRGRSDTLELKLDALVFGIPASEITAVKSGDRVAKFRVLYRTLDDRKRGKQAASLEERVLAGIAAFTGQSVNRRQPVIHNGVQISTISAANGDVTVEFARAS
jgi:hypothetical protein